jgi:hypothetical protein
MSTPFQLGKRPPVFTISDLPGYGHAVASTDEKRAWKVMIRDYLGTRQIISRWESVCVCKRVFVCLYVKISVLECVHVRMHSLPPVLSVSLSLAPYLLPSLTPTLPNSSHHFPPFLPLFFPASLHIPPFLPFSSTLRCCVLVDCTRGLCDADYNIIAFLNKVSVYSHSHIHLLTHTYNYTHIYTLLHISTSTST